MVEYLNSETVLSFLQNIADLTAKRPRRGRPCRIQDPRRKPIRTSQLDLDIDGLQLGIRQQGPAASGSEGITRARLTAFATGRQAQPGSMS